MKKVLEWLKPIIIAVIVAFIINNFILLNVTIPTGSMEPTLMVSDRLFANRLSYTFGKPDRGDIVVFNGTDEEKLLVKRVIGLPGDVLAIHNGKVYINDELLNDYVDVVIAGNFGPYEVPEDHYFMMGDNRNNSKDSRYWTNTFVPLNHIEGRVFMKYLPKFEFY